MKRDMEFVRDLLSKIEEADGHRDMVELLSPDATDDDWKRYRYHLTLLNEAGLVKGISARDEDGQNWLQVDLTWAGHEFLDTVRDPDVWQRTKDGAKKVGNFSMPFLLELGKAYGKHVAKEKLGLEL